MLIRTPDKRQTWLTDLLPARAGLAHTVHSVSRIVDSTGPCGHTVGEPSGTKRIGGAVSPLQSPLDRSTAALASPRSLHPPGRQRGSASSHAPLVFRSCHDAAH